MVYVLNHKNKPLMPTERHDHVRWLLKNKKAVVVSTNPFTIKLKYQTKNYTQELILGIDPGRTNIGATLVTEIGEAVYSAQIITNNKDVTKHMKKRAAHRRAKKNNTITNPIVKDRVLPKCKEPIHNNYIINTESKFANRKRPTGWLTPTANQLLLCHLNSVDKIQKILPISKVVVEINKFDFQAMDNPNIKKWEYQKGPLKGYKSVENLVCEQQNGYCIFCNKPIEHYHHIIPVSQGGSESLHNRAGVCTNHHNKLHTNPELKEKLAKKKAGLNKKYGALSVINQIIPKLIEELTNKFPSNTYITTGRSTKELRDRFSISKDHYLDAYCIACSILDIKIAQPPIEHFTIKKYRRHDRAHIKAQRERTYYFDGKVVAKNRKPRFEQNGPSLQDFLNGFPETERRSICNKLKIVPSKRSYNNLKRNLPGTTFVYDDKRYVMSGQSSGGKQLLAEGYPNIRFDAKKCIIIRSCGLVYI